MQVTIAKLSKSAKVWWRTFLEANKKKGKELKKMKWPQFVGIFRKDMIPNDFLIKQRQSLARLSQDGISVADYA